MEAVVFAIDCPAIDNLERRRSEHVEGEVGQVTDAALSRVGSLDSSLGTGDNISVLGCSLNLQLVIVEDLGESVDAGLLDLELPVETSRVGIPHLVANRLGDLVDLPVGHFDSLLLVGLEVDADEFDLSRDAGVEVDGQGDAGLGLGAQAKGNVLRVEDGGALGEDIDDLLAHNEGVVVEDIGDLDIVFGYGEFAVVEDLDEPDEP